MRLSFKNDNDEEIEVGNPTTKEETMCLIREFLKEHNFIHYRLRMWKEDKKGNSRYIFDMGNHEEFFTLEVNDEGFEIE